MNVDPISPAIGAEISGISLNPLPPADAIEAIYEALVRYKVIFFHDQDLSGQAQLDFASQFGEIDKPHAVYPHVDGLQQVTLLENDENRPPDTNAWHTDLTYYPNPPFASLLHARELPPTGGDTLWASMAAAYNALPDALKSEIEDLDAIHDPGTFRNQFAGEDKDVAALNEAMGRVGSAIHPVARTHPVSGERFLYVNRSFTEQILGYGSADSARLLNYLFDHINQPEFQIRPRWRKGDVVMWDNRITQHYAVADYSRYRRMHRVTIVNDQRAPA